MMTLEEPQSKTVPDWFKPGNIHITDHAVQRFLERVNPYASYKEAREAIQRGLNEGFQKGTLTFKRSESNSAWCVTVDCESLHLAFVTFFPCEENGVPLLHKSGKLILATVVDALHGVNKPGASFRGNYQAVLQQLEQKDVALTLAREKLAAARCELNEANQRYLSAMQIAAKYKRRGLEMFVQAYEVYQAEKKRRGLASKRQCQLLEGVLESYLPGWQEYSAERLEFICSQLINSEEEGAA